MIEIVFDDKCIKCDACVRVCPNDVFDTADDGIAFIARQQDCVTCYLCEAWCPTDALYVSPRRMPEPSLDHETIRKSPQLGSFRRSLGWDHRKPGAGHVDAPEAGMAPLIFPMERATGDHRLK